MMKIAAALLISFWSFSASAQRINYGEGFTLWMHWVPAVIALGFALLFMLQPKRWKYLGLIGLAWVIYIALASLVMNHNASTGLLGFAALLLAPWALVAGMAYVYLVCARRR